MTASTPQRIQRKRTKGYRMPEGAVYVGRPTLWGNQWSLYDAAYVGNCPPEARAEWCVARYRSDLEHLGMLSDYSDHVSEKRWAAVYDDIQRRGVKSMAEYAVVLAGFDLACWCPLDRPCHADVLLELANAPVAVSA